jgi:hypothetical protein
MEESLQEKFVLYNGLDNNYMMSLAAPWGTWVYFFFCPWCGKVLDQEKFGENELNNG